VATDAAGAAAAGRFATACGAVVLLWRPLRPGVPASTPATDRVWADLPKHEQEAAEALGLRGESWDGATAAKRAEDAFAHAEAAGSEAGGSLGAALTAVTGSDCQLQSPHGDALCLAWAAPGGRDVLAAGCRGAAVLWAVPASAPPALLAAFTHPGPVRALAWAADGDALASASGARVFVWRVDAAGAWRGAASWAAGGTARHGAAPAVVWALPGRLSALSVLHS
jgi:hypothetical protein